MSASAGCGSTSRRWRGRWWRGCPPAARRRGSRWMRSARPAKRARRRRRAPPRAGARMSRRAERGAAGGMVEADVPPPVAPEVARAKFEASPERVRRKDAGPIAVGDVQPKPVAGAAGGSKKDVSKDEGMSRLMKAKKRAQEEMTDE